MLRASLFKIGVDHVADFFVAVAHEIADPVLLFVVLAFEFGPDLDNVVVEQTILVYAE